MAVEAMVLKVEVERSNGKAALIMEEDLKAFMYYIDACSVVRGLLEKMMAFDLLIFLFLDQKMEFRGYVASDSIIFFPG